MNTGIIQSSNMDYYTFRQNAADMNNKAQSSNAFGNVLGNRMVSAAGNSKAPITLHYQNDAEEGEECIGAWASVQTGMTTSVYKPADFSEDNPFYRVKIWKPDGSTEERMVDVMQFNPKSADSFDHYAFACYLEKEEGTPVWSTSLDNYAKTADDLYQKRDWIQAYKDRAQELFDVGYYEVGMNFKKMYERLMEQFMKIAI